jgi:hypothetical protein
MNKIKITDKHRANAQHHARFVDKYWWPDFTLTDEIVERFIRFESYGPKSLNSQELESIIPLTGSATMVGAKGLKELTIKMLYEECAEYWSKGWGFYHPIAATIKWELKEKAKDKIYIRALIKIARAMKEDFIAALSSFTGLSHREKSKYLEEKTGHLI